MKQQTYVCIVKDCGYYNYDGMYISTGLDILGIIEETCSKNYLSNILSDIWDDLSEQELDELKENDTIQRKEKISGIEWVESITLFRAPKL